MLSFRSMNWECCARLAQLREATCAGGVATEGSVLGGDKALAEVGAGAEGNVGTMKREPPHILWGQWSRQNKVTVLPWMSTV